MTKVSLKGKRRALSEAEKELRAAQILEAALDVFAEKGFAAARLDDVAIRAGVSKGTLYLYFSDKEDLFRHVVREGVIPNVAAIERLAASYSGPIAPFLRQTILKIAEMALTTKIGAIPKLVILEAGNFPKLAEFYRDEVIARGRGVIVSLIERGIKTGEFRDINPSHGFLSLMGPVFILVLTKDAPALGKMWPASPLAQVPGVIDLVLAGLANQGKNNEK